MKKITELSFSEAKVYFLKEESYFNFNLPKYFVFKNLIQNVSAFIGTQELSSFHSMYTAQDGNQKPQSPAFFENVNYKFLNNKDGKFAWRPFQLIHPALYVSLVHKITEETNWNLILGRFQEFQSDSKIRCYSLPLESGDSQSDKATSVSGWWLDIEQQSIELALKYDYVLHTDISDCYGSIYTHSVPWALHNKQFAKQNRRDLNLIGNCIDKHLQDMSYGQTNGIPQGSVLMDFLAEIILGYADLELTTKLIDDKIQDYEIIRYRDDYRIFSNNPQTCEHIAKRLTEILIDLGMRLNAQKTIVSNNIIKSSIKSDKYYWISARKGAKSIQQHLLLIHKLSEEFPNSGTLSKALNKFYSRIKDSTESTKNIKVLLSILTDIMFKNPRTYPIATANISKLLSLIPEEDKKTLILGLISKKFEKIPNTAHIKIWLQRLTIKLNREIDYKEPLTDKVNNRNVVIWESDWLNNELKNLINGASIISEEIIGNMDIVITSDEIQLFKNDYDNDYASDFDALEVEQ